MSTPADQQARDRALRLDRHVITIAPAGSGKTGLLVRRALRALASVDTPEAVVCITFTNKAAAEIRLRIVEAEIVEWHVKVGDKVLFGKYAGTEIKVAGEDRLILREDDILGIIED